MTMKAEKKGMRLVRIPVAPWLADITELNVSTWVNASVGTKVSHKLTFVSVIRIK
jgi:hypothetical protein